MERTTLPKTVRFEIFKRDKFTCQYCGKSAPDVILEIDHIIPVAKGGTNEIMNLVTACRDCNRGKRDKTLDDDTAILKQKQQLETLQDRREQLEMMAAWRESLKDIIDLEVDEIDETFFDETGMYLFDYSLSEIRKLIKRFGFNEVAIATKIAIDRYYTGGSRWSLKYVVEKIGGICYNRKKARESSA